MRYEGGGLQAALDVGMSPRGAARAPKAAEEVWGGQTDVLAHVAAYLAAHALHVAVAAHVADRIALALRHPLAPREARGAGPS